MAEYVTRRTGPIEVKKNEYQERKRCIYYLISDYLKSHNLYTSYETFKQETQLNDQFEVCDNIDLDIILQEYQSYYHVKFQRDPKILRKSITELQTTSANHSKQNVQFGNRKPQRLSTDSGTRVPRNSLESNSRSILKDASRNDNINKDEKFKFEIINIDSQENFDNSRRRSSVVSEQEMKPLADFSGYTPEWREMADQIMKEFIPKTLGITWKNCIGLDKPVELLKEATIYPLMYPKLFQNLTSTWNGILLYGPPGTGKTLLAKALACEGETNFINVMISTFVSKYRGESEKMIKVLFDLAKYYEPTTIFIDEIDALLSETKETNHEASCRFKSELLIQMDGLLTTNSSVFILATTNSPWSLDKALLRRFEKRILIPLPNEEAKINMLKAYTNLSNDNKNNLKEIIELTEQFSGSDIKNVCKELEMILIREQLKDLNIKNKKPIRRNPTMEDLIKAIKTVKPSTIKEYNKKLLNWHDNFGCI